MKRLQTCIGATLFRRRGRRMILTEQGDIALRYARRVVDLNDELLDTLRRRVPSVELSAGRDQSPYPPTLI
jgi:DNA-binding transcriptional LysR family regulator